MNASAAGWLPDPSGRNEYRYWNGTSWTGDVATNGVTSVDPPAGPLPPPGPAPSGAAGAPGPAGAPGAIAPPEAPTAPHDVPTAAHGPPTAGYDAPTGAQGPPSGPYDAPTVAQGPQTGPYDAPTVAQGPPTAMYQPQPGYGPPGAPSGAYPAPGPGGSPPRSGPSKGLLIGLGVLAVALIAGIAWALTRDDGDGETATDDISTTDPEAPADDGTAGDLGGAEDSLGDLEPDDDSGTGGSDDPFAGADADSIDEMLDDPVFRGVIVEGIAQGMEEEGLTREQAECFAEGVLDTLSAEQLFEIGQSGGDMSSVSSEEAGDLIEMMSDCDIDPSALD
jgi:hypothetical protein